MIKWHGMAYVTYVSMYVYRVPSHAHIVCIIPRYIDGIAQAMATPDGRGNATRNVDMGIPPRQMRGLRRPGGGRQYEMGLASPQNPRPVGRSRLDPPSRLPNFLYNACAQTFQQLSPVASVESSVLLL
jgi:hypothetical protein